MKLVSYVFLRQLTLPRFSSFQISLLLPLGNSLSSSPFPATKEQTDSRANKRQRVHDPAISPVLAAGNERDEREREFIDDRLKSIVGQVFNHRIMV